jgi:hypothetical protein
MKIKALFGAVFLGVTWVMASSAVPQTVSISTSGSPPAQAGTAAEDKPTSPSKTRISIRPTAPKKPRTASEKKNTGIAQTETRFVSEEAKNLLVPDQKYLIRFEDEESLGKVAPNAGKNSLNTSFSSEEVSQFRSAVQYIADYRQHLHSRCLGASNQSFSRALDKYLAGLAAFNRRALPVVADITENNNLLVLIVNRTALIDAPVLISRYLQFKKQRFKENMGRFLAADATLVTSLVNIAKLLHVELSDDEWNKTYVLRDNVLEQNSLWSRDSIFDATDKLASVRETTCVVEIKTSKDGQTQSSSTAR